LRSQPSCTIGVLQQRTKDMKKLLSTAVIIAARVCRACVGTAYGSGPECEHRHRAGCYSSTRPAELGLIANVKFRTAVRSLAGAVAHQKMEQDRITRSKAIRSERNWSQSGARVCFGSTTSAVRMTGGSPTEKIFAIRSTWRRCAFFSVIARLSASSATWKPG
jgi:hypothetical protein